MVAGGGSYVYVPTREEKLAGAESGIMKGLQDLFGKIGDFVNGAEDYFRKVLN